jgi:translation initiation factor 2B subunit (eIF-2B alpha/beta/delta family)
MNTRLRVTSTESALDRRSSQEIHGAKQRIEIQLKLAEAVLRAIETGDTEKLKDEIRTRRNSLVLIETELQDREDQLSMMLGGVR